MRALLLILLLALTLGASAQPSRAVEAQRAAQATAWLTSHLWVRGYESPFVVGLRRRGGAADGAAWCGLTQREVQRVLGLPWPNGPAGSYNWFLDKRRAVPRDSVRVGLCVAIYSPARGRIGHITRAMELVPPLRKGRPPRGAYCGGGNEGSGPNNGIHRTLYPLGSMYALSNWLH